MTKNRKIVQLNMGAPALNGAKPLKCWGDRRGLNPQPPVPQTGRAGQDWRFFAFAGGHGFPSDRFMFRVWSVRLFKMNRGAPVCAIHGGEAA